MKSLGELMQSYADRYGFNDLEGIRETAIPGVWFYRSSKGNQRQPFVYQSGIIVMGKGHKHIHIGNQPVHYGPDDYLVVGVPMPLECEAFPEDDSPLLGLTINVDSTLLHRLVNELEAANFQAPTKSNQDGFGLTSVKMADDMLESCKRLMLALHSDLDTKLLGESLLNEIVYRVLTGTEGQVLFNLAHHDGQYARVAKAMNKMHQSYADGLTVQHLAEEANMSISAFHSAFRKVTLESPLQYLKKVRLNKAKELIQLEGRRVNDAAHSVGYTSTSQFSREFKRHFNMTPKGCVA
ncbi:MULTISPECIES: AraC family transcriptional regulator [unclassified Aliivibrio]|jgi:AraC-like DNA-binding protein|uniref:AraC family transcriptional regulator n=1 Tax=unclassified Aliivibrio TaxID=2645654 RepID=UPI00080E4F9A|nr:MULTISPECIES: AraC family transcriptional regulator [unclassified Aliivibrio]OCH12709.1 XRE family transcriptional regulator [Aliivibrio sp. 1S165]OCH16420.1 XRE family transcriptional regulator [Aliivibrio sp. 1S128]OCH36353.1 XRE family transcriptional regulator [Aliivibrio sp. 1S175]